MLYSSCFKCLPASLLISSVVLVLRRWSYRVNLAALFWIFSRVSILFCLCGFHATVAYSSFGRINML